MPWVKLDERFARHPKVLLAGPLAIAMHVAGLCYCNEYLTDGFVPRRIAPTLIDLEDFEGVEWKSVAAALVQAGVWMEAVGGYQIHDFLEYQPSKADILELRTKRAEAGRRGGIAKAKQNSSKSKSSSSSKTASEPEAKMYPGSVPVPVEEISMVPSEPASLSTNGTKAQQIARKHLAKLAPILAAGSSFDLLDEFKSIWTNAWQDALEEKENPKAVGINLLGQFIASVTDQEPDWGRAGQLVGRYGKLALLGIDEGLIANADDPYRYAFRVCQNKATEHRMAVEK